MMKSEPVITYLYKEDGPTLQELLALLLRTADLNCLHGEE